MHDLRDGGLPPPPAALARVLHAHAHRRDPVADRQRHRRRADASSPSTATSIVSNVTTVLATRRRRCSCSTGASRCSRPRRCCRSSCWLTRRVGRSGGKITDRHARARWPTSPSLVQESLSVSGILLGKTMGRGAELAERFERESADLADLEVRSRMAGRWMMASIQTTFAVMPALDLPVRRASDRRGAARSRSARWSPSRRCRRGSSSRSSRCSRVGRRRPDLDSRCSSACFEYLDLPRRHRASATDARALDRTCAARSTSTACGSATRRRAWTLRDVDVDVPAGTTTRDRRRDRRRARRRSATCWRGSTTPSEGAVTIDGTDVRDLTLRRSRWRRVGVVSQETYLFHAIGAREPALRAAGGDATTRSSDAARAAQIHDLIARLPDGYDTDRRRARLPLLRRREAADRDRPHDPAQPADPRARRGDQRARHRDRAPFRKPSTSLARGRTTVAIAHRLSTIRDAGPDRRARPRRDRRAAAPRRAAGHGRPLRRRWSRRRRPDARVANRVSHLDRQRLRRSVDQRPWNRESHRGNFVVPRSNELLRNGERHEGLTHEEHQRLSAVKVELDCH